MTTLTKDQPYFCRFAVHAGGITTVCDNQCEQCIKKEKDERDTI